MNYVGKVTLSGVGSGVTISGRNFQPHLPGFCDLSGLYHTYSAHAHIIQFKNRNY